jgi:hypothetical protein
VFDLPLAIVSEHEVWDEQTGVASLPIDEMMEWAITAESNELPKGWTSPPREQLEELLPAEALTVETGPFARQGRLQREERRLSLSIPLLHRTPAELSPRRRACLDALLDEIQYRTRLVRLVHREATDGRSGVSVEADLTGAPHFATPQLLRIGLDAARHVVSQHISTVELLVDPTVSSTVWEFPSAQERPAEGSWI